MKDYYKQLEGFTIKKYLGSTTEKDIEGQVKDAVEHAWSIGRIKRGGIFET